MEPSFGGLKAGFLSGNSAARPAANSTPAGEQETYSSDVSSANIDAAETAFKVGQRCISNGDLPRAIRLLQKAIRLHPGNPTYENALRAAERELAATAQEAQREAEHQQQDYKQSEHSGGWDQPEGAQGSHNSHSADSGSQEEPGTPFWQAGLEGLQKMMAAAFTLLKIQVLLQKASDLKNNFFDVMFRDPAQREKWLYLFYYWRARLRVPFRIFLAFLCVFLIYKFPWPAYAIACMAVAGLGVWLAPLTNWNIPRPVAIFVASFFLMFSYRFPVFSLSGYALSLWCLVLYVTPKGCLIVSAALAFIFYFPWTFVTLLCLALWGLFLYVLPRICLGTTAFLAFAYLFPWACMYTVVGAVSLVVCWQAPWMTLPVGAVLFIIWMFPLFSKIVAGIGFLVVFLPFAKKIAIQIGEIITAPYGGTITGMDPKKIKDGAEAVECVLSAGENMHYDVMGLPPNATSAQVKSAYKRMALLLHPDKNPSADAKKAFERLTDAMDVLQDLSKRAEYDAELAAKNGEADEEKEESATQKSSATEGEPATNSKKPVPPQETDPAWKKKRKPKKPKK